MRHPIEIAKIIAILLFLPLFFLSTVISAGAADTHELLAIKKDEKPEYTRITYSFSSLPEFSVKHSGARVDLFLENVVMSPDLRSLPEDERLLKVVVTETRQQLQLSILLHQLPEKVIAETNSKESQIIMDILWNKSGPSRPAIAFKLAELPPHKSGKRAARLQQKSPWQGRWFDFFSDYRSYWDLDVQINYTLPKLTPLVVAETSPLWPLQQHADKNMNLSLIQTATNLTGLNSQQIVIRDLLLVEAQLRTGSVEAALARLKRNRDEETEASVRVEYLTAYGQALSGQPYVAQLTLQKLISQLSATDPLAPEVYLLAAETALAVKLNKVALELLEDRQIKWPTRLLPLVKLRVADAYSGLGELAHAFEIYKQVAQEPGLFALYPHADHRAAYSAYRNERYSFSRLLYSNLVDSLAEEPGGNDLILLGAGLSAYAGDDLRYALIYLQQATIDYPNSEGADRSALRLIDIQVINGGELQLGQAIMAYADLGDKSQVYMVREESRFKNALALYLLGDKQESVAALMQFKHEFRNSELKLEANQLIMDQLPAAIHELLEQKNDLAAVVMAEQNRNLLLRRGFNPELLYDIASAFDRLGLHARASRVLLYLLNRSKDEMERQALYLPLAQSYVKQFQYAEAGRYAGDYVDKYPQGENAGDLFEILLDALVREKRYEELRQWLQRPNRPSSFELEIRAAGVYWRLKDYVEVIQSLETARSFANSLPVKETSQLAEAYFYVGGNEAASKIYKTLYSDPIYGVQARYRGAQILLQQQQFKAAIEQLKEIVATSATSPWGKLAQDLLIQETN